MTRITIFMAKLDLWTGPGRVSGPKSRARAMIVVTKRKLEFLVAILTILGFYRMEK